MRSSRRQRPRSKVMVSTGPLDLGGALQGAAPPAASGWGARLRPWLSVRWVAVAVIVVGWFVYYPIVDNFVVSTTDEDIFTGETTYVGLANYERLIHDPVVLVSLGNNALYALISIVFQVCGAFVLAAMIEGLRSEGARRFWRAVYFIPSAISITVTGLLFYFIYQPDIGLLNAGLE